MTSRRYASRARVAERRADDMHRLAAALDERLVRLQDEVLAKDRALIRHAVAGNAWSRPRHNSEPTA